MKDSALEARVWRAVELSSDPPALAQALHAFLPASRLGVSRTVPTARIRRIGGRIDVRFGEAFLREHLGDDRDFLFVLLHEIYHHVLGHLRIRPGDELTRRCPAAANIAADMMVNRVVVDRYFPGGVPLLSRLYKNGLPGCLLKPADTHVPGEPGQGKHRARAAFLAGMARAGHNRHLAEWAWSVHRMAWHFRAPHEQLLEAVIELLDLAGILRFESLLLLGSHDGTSVDGIPWEGVESFGAGPGGELEEGQVVPVPAQDAGGLAIALRRALGKDPSRQQVRMAPVSGVTCSPGRSDLAFLAAGQPVFLFHGARAQPDHFPGAHVYLDVSGSLDSALPRLYGGLANLRDLVADPVHLFSTQVVDCRLDDLARGIRRTTGGTCFTPVLEHALAGRYRQIVVVTDGIGPLSDETGREFARSGAGLHLVLVGESRRWRRDCPLVEMARSVTCLG